MADHDLVQALEEQNALLRAILAELRAERLRPPRHRGPKVPEQTSSLDAREEARRRLRRRP